MSSFHPHHPCRRRLKNARGDGRKEGRKKDERVERETEAFLEGLFAEMVLCSDVAGR
jgi:hypothetical protein